MAAFGLVGLLVSAAQATTIAPTSYDNDSGMMVNIKVNGTELHQWAGPFNAIYNGASVIDVYCLDFFAAIDYQTYTVNTSSPIGTFLEDAARVYTTFVGNVRAASGETRRLAGAALQVALWEVTTDGYNPGAAAMDWLTTGNFRKSSEKALAENAALEGIVKSYLGASLQPVGPNVTLFTSASSHVAMQTLIGDPIPEPGTWAMIGAGLLMVGVSRARRS